MRSLRKYLSLCALLSPVLGAAQADVHFSQFYETSVLRNPALVGVYEKEYKIAAVNREQWSTISHPFQTSMLSGEARFAVSHASTDFISTGLLFYYDKAGSVDRKITGVYPALNYHKSLDPNRGSFLSMGFTAGYLQYSFDPTKATYNNQYQNGFQPGIFGESLPVNKISILDVGVGLNFHTMAGENKDVLFMIGASAYHLTRPMQSFYKDPNMNMAMRWNANVGFVKQASDVLVYQVHANYAQQGQFREIIGGGLLGWNVIRRGGIETLLTIYAGAFYRYKDAVAPVFKLRYKDLSFSMSYDINTSSLKDASNMRGGYEIMLIKSGMLPSNDAAAGKVFCPRF